MSDELLMSLRGWLPCHTTTRERAADEIERLRAELAAAKAANTTIVDRAQKREDSLLSSVATLGNENTKLRSELAEMRHEICEEREKVERLASSADDANVLVNKLFAERDALRAELAAARQVASEHETDAAEVDSERFVAWSERDRAVAELAAEREQYENANDANKRLSAALLASERRADIVQGERDALREALRPFAKAADNFDSFPINDAEEWFAYRGQSSFNNVVGAITVGDLRRARAALGGGE